MEIIFVGTLSFICLNRDRELQFWDQTYCLSTSREVQQNDLPCTQICSLDSVPIKLNYG
jgi:hypothetical protein